MGKRLNLFWIVLFFMGLTAFEPAPDKASLTVELTNVRSSNGKIFIFIYNYENQYPDNPFLHFEVDKKQLSSGKLSFVIPNSLSKGKYAISALDDENANEDLDLFFGIPTEGYGFSNNVFPFLSLPEYEDLLFDLEPGQQTIQLTLQYIL